MKQVMLQEWLDTIDLLIRYAEKEQDFVLAAKCEDVRVIVVEKIEADQV